MDISYKYDFEKRRETNEYGRLLPKPIMVNRSPSPTDWAKCREVAKLLKYFYDLTIKVLRSLYVTTNNSLQEIYGVYLLLEKMEM